MRLKRGVQDYIMPRGMADFYEAFVQVGPIYYNIRHINIKDINLIPSRDGKILGIPAYVARCKQNDRDWVRLYPVPEKAWKLTIRYTEIRQYDRQITPIAE